MSQNEPAQHDSAQNTHSTGRIRNRAVLPDGLHNEPLGSGVITGLLGIGGMANVYEIWNSRLEINRAVKLLHPNCTKEIKQRFDTEIKITAKLHHANIVEIHAVGNWNGLPYIEMERIDGKTIEELISQRGAFPPQVCTAIGVMIGKALRYAHNQEYVIYGKKYRGVIHRDLKPSNIMISNRGIVKLMDFGIARPADTSIHTTDGSILGTIQYLSPEQMEGKEPDIRTDIYTLGAVFYEMITGRRAFPEKNAAQLMISRLKNDFKPLNCYNLKIPVRLRNLIHKCMTKERQKRIQDASSFLSEITAIHKTLTPLSPEQVLKQFVASTDSAKNVLSLKFRIPVFPVISVVSTAVVICLFILHGSKIKAYYNRHFISSEDGPSVVEIVRAPLIDAAVEPSSGNVSVAQSKIPEEAGKPEKGHAGTVIVKQSRAPDLIGQLKSFHGTADLMTIFVQEVKSCRYETALEVFAGLKPDEKASEKAVIYRIRALKGLGRYSELQRLLTNEKIDDAEFYVEKARYFIDNKSAREALDHLRSASSRPAAFIENNFIRLERLYLTARCKSMEFDSRPSLEYKNRALESWYEVKAELQTSKDHPYFKEADLQMQRITNKASLDKG